MKLSHEKLKALCQKKQLSIKKMLARAGVSRNAFYSLLRKDSLLPGSVTAIADFLGVPPAEFIAPDKTDVFQTKKQYRQAKEIHDKHSRSDPDNILHTLILLDEPPIERLRRALRRGRQFNFQQ